MMNELRAASTEDPPFDLKEKLSDANDNAVGIEFRARMVLLYLQDYAPEDVDTTSVIDLTKNSWSIITHEAGGHSPSSLFDLLIHGQVNDAELKKMKNLILRWSNWEKIEEEFDGVYDLDIGVDGPPIITQEKVDRVEQHLKTWIQRHTQAGVKYPDVELPEYYQHFKFPRRKRKPASPYFSVV